MSERTLRTITVNQIGYPLDGEKSQYLQVLSMIFR